MADVSDPNTLSPAKRALYELRSARARINELERAQNEPIAVVGIGLRTPGGASDTESFWRLLRDGRDVITEIPSNRWDIEQYFDADPDAAGKMTTRYGAFLDRIDEFDAQFFGISPREAATMDPQQRLLLEVAWAALENAGQTKDRLQGNAGVFLALSNSDYGRLVLSQQDAIDVYSSTGSNFAIASGRISYLLGLSGPSMVVDTACSGSLVAVHLACQSLRAGECRAALAGGVNVILTPEITINFSKSRMMARDGRCKTFDVRADGYVRGEGCGIVVLKRLSDALAERDNILAVIRGSAVNQDGASGGLTVPNGPAQEAVIRRALTSAQLTPNDVDYIEAHGTGTSLGDPIEAHALAAVFGPGRDSRNPLVVGSLKTNVGHLEAAAGITGFIKAVLALQHETIPAHLHFTQMNPHIDWGQLPVEIPVEAKPWKRGTRARIAGISSFGFSGTNAHVVVEEAPNVPATEAATKERQSYLLPLSAKTPEALNRLIAEYREDFAKRIEASNTPSITIPQNGAKVPATAAGTASNATLADICYTASVGRAHFPVRATFQGETVSTMERALSMEPTIRGVHEARPEIVFLFTGQGAQWPGMGKELYETHPAFRDAIDTCTQLLAPHVDRPLTDLLFSADEAVLNQTRYTQPALFALQWALVQLWKSIGIEPTTVFGHSVGEYVAMCVAGVWSLADGLRIIAERARLTDALEAGWGMSAVQKDRVAVEAAIGEHVALVAIAAANGPLNTVISGRLDALQEVEARLRSEGTLVTRLNISHGFHSPQMEAVAGDFGRMVAQTTFHPPRVTIVSSVTGKQTTLDELRTADYWRRQVRDSVLFQVGMETLANNGAQTFLEIGPAPVLIGMGQQCIGNGAGLKAASEAAPTARQVATQMAPRDIDTEALWVASLRKDVGAWEQILDSVAQLYVHGADILWDGVYLGEAPRIATLPTYPFERQRYWIEETAAPVTATPPAQAWSMIREAGLWQSRQGRLDLSLDRYARGWEILERLTNAYIINAFTQLGAFQQTGESHSIDSLVAQTGIQPSFVKLVERWMRRLVTAGVLTVTDETFSTNEPLTAPSLESIVGEAERIFVGSDRVFFEYVTSCGSQLAAYLTGQLSTLETLFPGGSFERAENLYEHAPLSAYCGALCRAVLDGFVRARRGAAIRAVEIGAGTGATTSSLLPVLPVGSEYHFTDLSDFFLNHARNKFSAYDMVRYGHLNAELPGGPQGYPASTFDVVAATNVLHATHDIRETLRNTKALLAPGGILILCEVTTYLPWYDITTGLIEGWQVFDDGLRGDHPLLAPEQWTELLRESGFEYVAALPEAGAPAEVLGQHVIIAQVAGTASARRGNASEATVGASAGAASGAITAVETEQVIAGESQDPSRHPQGASDLRRRLQEAAGDDRQDLLVDVVRQALARALRVADPDSLDRRRRLSEFGIDSLLAVELRNRLAKTLGLDEPLPATLVFDYPTIEAIAEFLGDVLGFGAEQTDVSTQQKTDNGEIAEPSQSVDLEALSEEDVEALLLRKLESL